MAEATGPGDRLTQSTPVQDALGAAGEKPVVVSKTMTLREVALAVVGHAAVRVIAVTGSDEKLAGIIRIPALCDDLFITVAPEDFIAEILRPGRLEEYGRLSHSRTAGDLMEAPTAVKLDDDVGAAFRLMHEHNLEGIPILDHEGRPVAYLDRFRLIAVWLKTHAA